MRVRVSAQWKTWLQITLTFSSKQSWKILDYRLDNLIGLLRNHIYLFLQLSFWDCHSGLHHWLLGNYD